VRATAIRLPCAARLRDNLLLSLVELPPSKYRFDRSQSCARQLVVRRVRVPQDDDFPRRSRHALRPLG